MRLLEDTLTLADPPGEGEATLRGSDLLTEEGSTFDPSIAELGLICDDEPAKAECLHTRATAGDQDCEKYLGLFRPTDGSGGDDSDFHNEDDCLLKECSSKYNVDVFQ
jgi:hypothetical protein